MASPKKIPATVTKVIRHSETIIEYTFLPKGRLPSFKPGQFLHLAIDPYDPSQNWPDSRVFSIANAPGSETIKILVSVKGRFTSRMANELVEGSSVWLKFPYGNFTFETPGAGIVLIAGGTGITPYISFFEDHCEKDFGYNISLYYGVREERFIIFKKMFEEFRKRHPKFNYLIFCEGPYNNKNNCKKGIIDILQIIKENPYDSNFYISGPPLMIDFVKKNLINHNILQTRIFIDEW